MEGVNIKLEDLIVNITNFQCMVMRQMVDALNRQSQAVERIDQAFRHFLSFQELKNPQKLVPMAISTPIVNVTPKLEACDDEPPVKMEEMSDPDWEGDDKTGENKSETLKFLIIIQLTSHFPSQKSSVTTAKPPSFAELGTSPGIWNSHHVVLTNASVENFSRRSLRWRLTNQRIRPMCTSAMAARQLSAVVNTWRITFVACTSHRQIRLKLHRMLCRHRLQLALLLVTIQPSIHSICSTCNCNNYLFFSAVNEPSCFSQLIVTCARSLGDCQ